MSAPFIQFYIGDYLRDTTGFTTEGHGAYILILFAMWNAGGWLPVAKLPICARMTPKKWAGVADDIMPLLVVDGDQCSQKRLLRELEKATGKSAERSKAGKLGAEAKRLKTQDAAQANAEAIATANAVGLLKHSSETINQIPEREEETPSLREGMSADADGNPQARPAPDLFGKSKAKCGNAEDEPRQAFDAYNVVAAECDWPTADVLTAERRKKLRARLKTCGGLSGWVEAMRKASESAFLRGESGRDEAHANWTPDLDFFLQEKSFTRLMEGKYNGRTATGGTSKLDALFVGMLGASEAAEDRAPDRGRGGGRGTSGDASGDYRTPRLIGPDLLPEGPDGSAGEGEVCVVHRRFGARA